MQVLSVSDTGRRRRWTDDEKIRIVEESLGDGVTLAEVARRHEVSRSQLYDWRYRYRHGLLGSGPRFLRVLNVEEASDGPDPDSIPAARPDVMTVDFGPRYRVSIPSGFDMEAAARLLNSLVVRP
jgi:transposase